MYAANLPHPHHPRFRDRDNRHPLAGSGWAERQQSLHCYPSPLRHQRLLTPRNLQRASFSPHRPPDHQRRDHQPQIPGIAESGREQRSGAGEAEGTHQKRDDRSEKTQSDQTDPQFAETADG